VAHERSGERGPFVHEPDQLRVDAVDLLAHARDRIFFLRGHSIPETWSKSERPLTPVGSGLWMNLDCVLSHARVDSSPWPLPVKK
jgi:hypothetical protein